ncbi:uncharacterized protein LOC106156519 [Lingula anatina]|uniref:Uncharacterized protein LOC106156519 n=1 Tax=Lingula anatina TaxID=7574 RepID=A0A1S3HQD9_LINAN|nr:uncharacterized protein LOC106156519 [Lingula anatina]|eukprot:XP_013387254.1 uncharacterized protein LOC106156519 [Lingula anatina]
MASQANSTTPSKAGCNQKKWTEDEITEFSDNTPRVQPPTESLEAVGACGTSVSHERFLADQGIHDGSDSDEEKEDEGDGIWSSIRGKFHNSFKDNTEALRQTKDGCQMYLMSNLKQQAIKWNDALRNMHEKLTRKK